MNKATLAERDHEIYWCTGLDGRRVLMKWHSLVQPGNQSGGYSEAFDPVQAIRFLDSDAPFLARYRPPGNSEPYQVRAAFGFGNDALDRKTGVPYTANPKSYPFVDHFHVVAHAETTPDRKVIVSNQEDFFRDFEKHHGAQIADRVPHLWQRMGSLQRLDDGDLRARAPRRRTTSHRPRRSPPSSVCAILRRCADVTPPATKPSWILVYIGSTTGRPTAP
jgi:hypothetical protein